jgi:ParB family chromosome partitioning protein
MNEEPARGRQLGRGLSALFGDEPKEIIEAEGSARPSSTAPITSLTPGKFQPRQEFDDDQLDALVQSVRAHGILQPLLVRRNPANPGSYEIVAGERRWRAAQLARLHEVPIVVKELTDSNALEIALIENIQRQDLNPLEEAEGYKRLITEFEHTQDELSRTVGKSRSHIANTLRLLNLPASVKKMLVEGDLTAGHARALLNVDNPDTLAKRIVKQGLNVRQTERLVQQAKATKETSTPKPRKDPDTVALEKDLSEMLGLRVAVNFRGDGGELIIHYKTLEQLDDVLHKLSYGKAPTLG